MTFVREKPIIRRSDRHEFRFYPQTGSIRIVPLVVRFGEIVPAVSGGVTLKRKDLQRMPEALECLVTLLNAWRVQKSALGKSTPEEAERMKKDAEGRSHIMQQRIDPPKWDLTP